MEDLKNNDNTDNDIKCEDCDILMPHNNIAVTIKPFN